jgi:purine catabolism regulator
VDSTLTLADLIADPTLDTTVVSGAGGLGRPIRWAQTSEVADPWKWLGPGELLMTVGLNLPASPEGQREFVRRIHAAGIAGLALGEDGLAPPVTEAMKEESERLGFPLLSTGPDTPFVVIARTVAAATARQQNRSVLNLSRLYQAAGEHDSAMKRSGQWVTELCGARIAVVDQATGCTVIGERAVADGAHRAHTLPTLRPAALLVSTEPDLDALTLVHLKQILAVDANVLLQAAMNDAAAGEANVRLALGGAAGKSEIYGGDWLAPDGFYRVLAVQEGQHERIALAFALQGLRPLVARWKSSTIALVGAGDLQRARDILAGLGLAAGVSGEQTILADLPGAIEEACSAQSAAVAAGESWTLYVGAGVSLLARSRSEAERIVAAVLGPVGGADLSPALRDSLFALLDNDLHWQKTADQLGVHRQTLAYRLRQVESLTGRSVRRVPELCELWLARSAWQLIATDSRLE